MMNIEKQRKDNPVSKKENPVTLLAGRLARVTRRRWRLKHCLMERPMH